MKRKKTRRIKKGISKRHVTPLFVLAILLVIFSISISSVIGKGRVTPLQVIQKPRATVCPGPVSQGFTRCHSKVVTDNNGRPLATTGPSGYGPLQFHTAYNLPNNANGIPIVAIVDAYDDPSALSDLNTYSTQYGIPNLPKCSGSVAGSSVPCFAKIDQNGGTSYPSFNSGWALEISLDVQIAHAICQNCSILLVEAASNSFGNLLTAENQAVIQRAVAVSNSWSAGEFSGETSYDSYFNHPGVAITASAGDSGYSSGTQYPAASQYVVSVGGTTLQLNSDNSYSSEAVWSGTGSGCSLYEAKPSWQKDSGCTSRTLNDVSADADPNTGAAVYDSAGYNGQYGWFQVGGTSLSSPLIASVYALAGLTPSVYEASVLYLNSSSLHDIVSGNNGTCSPAYLCTGLAGYDGPTGLGSPIGLTAFGGSLNTNPTPTPTTSVTPTPTNVPQTVTVSITFPPDGGTVTRRSKVTISTIDSSNVTKVNFSVNGSLICSVTASPFNCGWTVPGKPNASYKITAAAYDSNGDSATSSVNVTAK